MPIPTKVNFIQGPGQHASILLNALVKCVRQVNAFHYWPMFSSSKYKDGILTASHSLHKLDTISKLIWGLRNRMPYAFLRPWHLDVYYHQYEQWVQKHIETDENSILWAWSQVSGKAIMEHKRRSGKVVLEYPMIHPQTWNETILEEAGKYYPRRYFRIFYSLFTHRMVDKALAEIGQSDKIVLLSDFACRTFTDRGVAEEKLQKITLPFSGVVTERQWRPSKKIIFLYAGRLELLKGIHYLIQAFNKLKTDTAELWLAGTILPEMVDFLKREAGPQIKLLGFQNKDQMRQLYRKADVFVFPTLQDSFGVVLLEAMSYGLPVIGSINSGAPELIQDGISGFLYDPYNVDALSSYMQRFIDNSAMLESVGKCAQERVAAMGLQRQYFNKVKETIDVLAYHA